MSAIRYAPPLFGLLLFLSLVLVSCGAPPAGSTSPGGAGSRAHLDASGRLESPPPRPAARPISQLAPRRDVALREIRLSGPAGGVGVSLDASYHSNLVARRLNPSGLEVHCESELRPTAATEEKKP